MRNYKKRLPGIDRSSEAKNPVSKSSALQKGTKEYTPLPFLGGLMGGTVGKILDPIGITGKLFGKK